MEEAWENGRGEKGGDWQGEGGRMREEEEGEIGQEIERAERVIEWWICSACM